MPSREARWSGEGLAPSPPGPFPHRKVEAIIILNPELVGRLCACHLLTHCHQTATPAGCRDRSPEHLSPVVQNAGVPPHVGACCTPAGEGTCHPRPPQRGRQSVPPPGSYMSWSRRRPSVPRMPSPAGESRMASDHLSSVRLCGCPNQATAPTPPQTDIPGAPTFGVRQRSGSPANRHLGSGGR